MEKMIEFNLEELHSSLLKEASVVEEAIEIMRKRHSALSTKRVVDATWSEETPATPKKGVGRGKYLRKPKKAKRAYRKSQKPPGIGVARIGGKVKDPDLIPQVTKYLSQTGGSGPSQEIFKHLRAIRYPFNGSKRPEISLMRALLAAAQRKQLIRQKSNGQWWYSLPKNAVMDAKEVQLTRLI